MQDSDGEAIENQDENFHNEEEMAQGAVYHDLQKKKECLMNLILSFLVYRPDVGYVKVSNLQPSPLHYTFHHLPLSTAFA